MYHRSDYWEDAYQNDPSYIKCKEYKSYRNYVVEKQSDLWMVKLIFLAYPNNKIEYRYLGKILNKMNPQIWRKLQDCLPRGDYEELEEYITCY